MIQYATLFTQDIAFGIFIWKKRLPFCLVLNALITPCNHTGVSDATCLSLISPTIPVWRWHYSDVIMSSMASQITSLAIIYSTVYSGVDQRKHQSSASLAFVWGIHRWPVNFPHKGPVTRKMLPFDDVIKTLQTRTPNEFLEQGIYVWG